MGFFRYPGGKSKLRKQITDEILKQAGSRNDLEYREPFFGGGSIGLQFIEDASHFGGIWLNDFDIGISCLWTSVLKFPEKLKNRVKNFKPVVNHFHEFKADLLELSSFPKSDMEIVDAGFKKLVIHQISYSGLGTVSGGPLGGAKQESDYGIACRWSPEYICKKIDKLHEQFSRTKIRKQCCTNLDFAELIEDDTCENLLYLDPPYFEKGGVLYQHGFQVKDHERLAESLKKSNSHWVLSYDDCEEIRKLYSWANYHSVEVKYSITATKNDEGERFSTKKPELLIYPK